MIEKIEINNTASYTTLTEIPLKQLNFIYGANGSGKTTISKILSNPGTYNACEVAWNSEEHEEIFVFNRPFVSSNFEEDASIPGIVTLGEESITIKRQINEMRNSVTQLIQEVEGINKKIQNQTNSLTESKRSAMEECWLIQREYGEVFSKALSGSRGTQERFFQGCIEAYKTRSEIDLVDYQILQERYTVAYAKKTPEISAYVIPEHISLEALKEIELLNKVITGNSDNPIGAFIEYLGASDWVKRGLEFIPKSNGHCPFCQRDHFDDIEKDIRAIFNGTYDSDLKQLNQYLNNYCTVSGAFIKFVQNIIENKYSILNYDEFERLFESFKEKAERNIEIIKQKTESPSIIVSIDNIYDIAVLMIEMIAEYNTKINEHNRIIQNQSAEREFVRKLVWRFIVSKIEKTLSKYLKEENGIQKGIDNLKKSIEEKKCEISQLNADAEKAGESLPGVGSTAKAINKILKRFGFESFQLVENPKEKGTYSVIRPDGSDASKTLSEGEHNFLAFLYFYHLCFGVQKPTEFLKNKILVIDDPISSMDSNVLFIVSTLVKAMINDCRNNENGIKQIVVLTHNVYFHKEITFLGNRDKFKKDEAEYLILRKKNEQTSVEVFKENPIQSSYDMLWEDLRTPSSNTRKGVFNTMRRILEYYFTVIGGIKYEECIDKFEGEDKLVCKALISYINDGSHSVYDDFIIPIEDSSIENYQRIFRLIFEKLNHINHYNMMMRNNEESQTL